MTSERTATLNDVEPASPRRTIRTMIASSGFRRATSFSRLWRCGRRPFGGATGGGLEIVVQARPVMHVFPQYGRHRPVSQPPLAHQIRLAMNADMAVAAANCERVCGRQRRPMTCLTGADDIHSSVSDPRSRTINRCRAEIGAHFQTTSYFMRAALASPNLAPLVHPGDDRPPVSPYVRHLSAVGREQAAPTADIDRRPPQCATGVVRRRRTSDGCRRRGTPCWHLLPIAGGSTGGWS